MNPECINKAGCPHDRCIPENCQSYETADSLSLPPLGSPALDAVLEERRRQDEKWGEQNHDPFAYLTVLGEEYGELCQCALHDRFGGPAAEHIRTEAVQVAAVALAIVECLDRGKWRWPVEAQENASVRGGAAAPYPERSVGQ